MGWWLTGEPPGRRGEGQGAGPTYPRGGDVLEGGEGLGDIVWGNSCYEGGGQGLA